MANQLDFDDQQVAALAALVATASAMDPATVGAYRPVYDFLNQVISETGGVDDKTTLFFRLAP